MGNAFDSPTAVKPVIKKKPSKANDPFLKSKSLDPSTYNLRTPVDDVKDEENSLNEPIETRPRLNENNPSSDSFSSDDDTEKFKAAVRANQFARLSEKRIYSKLANEAKVPRKVTIDVEGCLDKSNNTKQISADNMIKSGYYKKLGIERGPALSESARGMPTKMNKSVYKEEEVNQLDKLDINNGIHKRHHSGCLEEWKEEMDANSVEADIEDEKNAKADDDDLDEPIKAAKFQRTNTVQGSTTASSIEPSEVIETSFATKDSGNWRLDLVKNSKMARSADRIRMDLLSKLTYQKIWLTPSQKPETHQTVFIYDWDDTLLCTSFLNPTGYYDESLEIPEIAKKHLEKLEKAVEKVLTASVKFGKTYIVTNAAEGWVQFSSKKYMPKVYDALQNVEVISARSLFEHLYPGDSYEWKIQAFTNIQKDLQSMMITNIIAWGDSRIEMEAARHIAKLFTTAFIKTVKFKETPTPEELIKQLNLVIQKLDHISSAPRNLTIRLERKNK